MGSSAFHAIVMHPTLKRDVHWQIENLAAHIGEEKMECDLDDLFKDA